MPYLICNSDFGDECRNVKAGDCAVFNFNQVRSFVLGVEGEGKIGVLPPTWQLICLVLKEDECVSGGALLNNRHACKAAFFAE